MYIDIIYAHFVRMYPYQDRIYFIQCLFLGERWGSLRHIHGRICPLESVDISEKLAQLIMQSQKSVIFNREMFE